MNDPLYWHCKKCAWVGTCADMVDLCCPKCGEFDRVSVMIFLPAYVVRKEGV